MEASASGIDGAVDACVASVYRKIRFARMPKTGVQIRHVLAFAQSAIR